MGSNPWTLFTTLHSYLGPCPSFVHWMIENKLYSCLMTFFLANMVETQLISTGAFEVSLGGQMVWSKLEEGRIPQPQELLSKMDSILGKLTQTEDIEPFEDLN